MEYKDLSLEKQNKWIEFCKENEKDIITLLYWTTDRWATPELKGEQLFKFHTQDGISLLAVKNYLKKLVLKLLDEMEDLPIE
jgi:hypothetical protein